MKKTTPKTITISDLLTWYQRGELEMSPKYQRNSVWNDKARSYLMDTIARGLPIPPIFLRQTVDPYTMITYREIIDGQQRVRTIIGYILEEAFVVKKSQNSEIGGKKFTQLSDDMREEILSYDITSEIVNEKDDAIIYDMFARLNSNNVVLNKQEIRNARYWGDFKVLVFELAKNYRDFFIITGLIKEKDVARMKDCETINSLLILMLEGIHDETESYVDSIYRKYDSEIPDQQNLTNDFNSLMDYISTIYKRLDGLKHCFLNKNYFYTLFAVLYHQRINHLYEDINKFQLNDDIFFRGISNFIGYFDGLNAGAYDTSEEYVSFLEFKNDHYKRTTSKNERINRIKYLNDYLIEFYKNVD